MRALKRHLIRAIWRLWQQCLSEQEQEPVLLTAEEESFKLKDERGRDTLSNVRLPVLVLLLSSA